MTPRTVVGVGVSPTLLVMDSAGSYLYVGNAGAPGSISVFSIDAGSGSLSSVAGSPFQIGISPLNMKLSPNGNFLYVSGAGSPQGYIEVWAVTAGVLTQPLVQLIQPGTNPYGMAIAPSGSFLYVANTGDSTISEYSIGSDGTLTELSGSPLGETYASPLSLTIDPSGKYLYAANEGSSNLTFAYTIGSDGSLTAPYQLSVCYRCTAQLCH